MALYICTKLYDTISNIFIVIVIERGVENMERTGKITDGQWDRQKYGRMEGMT